MTRVILDKASLLCKNCGAAFVVPGSKLKTYECRDGKTRHFCSAACYNEARRIKKAPTFACETCGVVKERRRFKMRSGRELGFNYSTRFCSPKCARAKQVMPRGHGKGFLDKNGYRLIYVDGIACFEHRVVMERKLGRKLRSHETVHHRDGNRSNNSDENLELWSSRHGKGQRVEDKIAFCKSFLAEYGVVMEQFSVSDMARGLMAC